jgi:ubiquinone/menaquinone biosynthesis C-methylase UbiE
MKEEGNLNRRVTGVQRHYQDFEPHPGTGEGSEWIEGLPITRAIMQWVGEGNHVLDLGSHEGDISVLIRQAGNDVVAVDLPELAEKARQKHGLNAIGHDLNNPFPFGDSEFDVVVAASVLDDIPDDLSFLHECNRVLKPEGTLIVVVPNEVSIFRRIQSLCGGMSRDFSLPTGYHCLHCYTLKGIKTLLQVSGFKVLAHSKAPKKYSKIPLRYWIEKILPATMATDLVVKARKPGRSSPRGD